MNNRFPGKCFIPPLVAFAVWASFATAAQPRLTGIDVDTDANRVTVHGLGESGRDYGLKWSEKLGVEADWLDAGATMAKEDGTFSVPDGVFRKPGFYRVERETGTGKHDSVQLWEGGPYWAETNLGAEEPWDCGFHFWWGDTVGYRHETDAWIASDGSSTNFSFWTENASTYEKNIDTLRSEGWITAEGVLAPEHDAAHVQWGGEWRMPTYQELYDLCYNQCDWTWTTTNGVDGYVVSGRGDYADKSIFLPVAGYGRMTSLHSADTWGEYWASVPESNRQQYYYSGTIYFLSGYHEMNFMIGRYFGLSIRPVRDTE